MGGGGGGVVELMRPFRLLIVICDAGIKSNNTTYLECFG